MPPEAGGASPDVDGDIENRAARHPHELALGRWRHLIMQPAQRPLQRVADVVVLHKSRLDPDRGEIARVPYLGEKTSDIADAPRHENFDFRQRGFHRVHGRKPFLISAQLAKSRYGYGSDLFSTHGISIFSAPRRSNRS